MVRIVILSMHGNDSESLLEGIGEQVGKVTRLSQVGVTLIESLFLHHQLELDFFIDTIDLVTYLVTVVNATQPINRYATGLFFSEYWLLPAKSYSIGHVAYSCNSSDLTSSDTMASNSVI